MNNKTAVILINKMSENPTLDELDVLDQAKYISSIIEQLGYSIHYVDFSIKIWESIEKIKQIQPDFVFNLAETVENRGEFAHLGPTMLNYIGVPYTGTHFDSMLNTTNKLITKKLLRYAGISTPDWFTIDDLDKISPEETYIIKPLWEEGSFGLNDSCVFTGTDKEYIEKIKASDKKKYFVEKYIEGRELYISILASENGPEVMPVVELIFNNYPDGKPKISNYQSKWHEDSFEYKNTDQNYLFSESDTPLLEEMKEMSKKCWHEFDLRGYVRIDFRVDSNSKPWVLEINANPALHEFSYFSTACSKAGYTKQQVFERIIADAYRV